MEEPTFEQAENIPENLIDNSERGGWLRSILGNWNGTTANNKYHTRETKQK